MELAEWLGGLEAVRPGDAREPEAAADRLEAAAGELADRLGGLAHPPWPLAVTNGVVADLQRCEGLAVARAGAGEFEAPDWRRLSGEALDAFVAHVLAEGPVADPVDDLLSMWSVAGDDDRVEQLSAFLRAPEVDRVAERREELAGLARAALAFAAARDRIPRVEVPLGATPGGILALRGRADVVLGGPGTGHPAVLIEVKSGGPHPEHHAQLRHYVLLAALRHGEMPAAAAVWYPDDSVSVLHVTGAAESSAERVAAATRRLADFWEGEPPTLRGGAHCAWCPVADTCTSAAPPGSGPSGHPTDGGAA